MLTEQQLRTIFEKGYDRTVWYNILRQNFYADKLKDKAADITGRISSNTYQAKAFELGSFQTTEGQLVGLYEVIVPHKAQLHRNRRALRNLLGNVYRNDVDAALVVFVQDHKWRFTYVSEIAVSDAATGKRTIKTTDPKRYTYLFGEGEKAKTASIQFSKLRKSTGRDGEGLALKTLQEAFNVEKMSKEFFNAYRKHYGYFTAYLTGQDENSKEISKPAASFTSVFSKDKKCARDFVKKLLGRIVFMYFLEKKGWLGVPAWVSSPTGQGRVGAWGDGNENFLSNLFSDAKHKENFHPNILVPLFYETLNTERKDELFKIDRNEFTKGDYHTLKVPFLNGGLFENDLPEADGLVFPDKLFANLFEFFDQYNFTVYEDSPDEHTVAVDPEMLGHIFENLLEDNKDKGAFYTPKEIVHYMCQESLIEYLYTKLNPSSSLSPGEPVPPKREGRGEVSRQAIEKLIKYQEAGDLIEYDETILKALRNVKVCDPAIGSGAFPMGILMEIYHMVETLFFATPDVTEKIWKMKGWNPAKVKSDIIQNSIYGVDIEKGAVDIARLRFWLSLVVDETKPQPLPNLDYKIVVGNSLLSKFGDKVIDIKWDYTTSHGTAETKKIIMEQVTKLKNVAAWQDAYYIQKGNKQKTQLDIRNIKIDILTNQLILNKKSFQQNNPKAVPLTGFALTSKQHQKNLDIEMATAGYNQHIEKLQTIKKDKNAKLDFFDWKIDFPEVMNREDKTKEGFDIVIGNPPYVQLQKMGEEADLLQQAGFKTFARTGDIYCLFYEKGNDILKANGNLIYITGSSWLRSNFGKSLRSFFLDNTNPKSLIDLSDCDIFQSATVLTTIMHFVKEPFSYSLKALRLTRKTQEYIKKLDLYFKINSSLIKHLDENAWTILDNSKVEIKSKIIASGRKLKNWSIEINYGIKTGLNEAFVIDAETCKQLIKEDKNSAKIIKPLLRGRDLKRYGFEFQKLYLINAHNGIKEKGILPINIERDFPAIYNHLKQFKTKLLVRADKGDNWFNLRNCAYLEAFEQPKIVYPNMVKDMSFAYDEKKHLLNDKCFIFSGEKLKYLLGIFNSKLFRFCFEDHFPELQGNSREIKAFVMKELPVKYPDAFQEKVITKMVNKVVEFKAAFVSTKEKETEIDACVYNLYNLSFEEACTIEGNTDWKT